MDSDERRRTTGGNFVRENTVKSIWKKGGAAGGEPRGDQTDPEIVDAIQTILSDNALLVNAAKAAVGAMREGNVTGAKSAGGSMY
jgi:hypothetical protein